MRENLRVRGGFQPLNPAKPKRSKSASSPEFFFQKSLPVRSRTIQFRQADNVWRVLPVGTGRCLSSSRVA
jgi:hypothetical protein